MEADADSPLYKRIKAFYNESKNAYKLNDDERPEAKKLVSRGLLWYSMDYDHVASYE